MPRSIECKDTTMATASPSRLQLERDKTRGLVHIRLNRPEVRNAFDATLIAELTETFERLDHAVRVVILSGNGKVFCAGADLQWMKESCGYSREQNAADARRLMRLFRVIDQSPHLVIARIHGAAIGGGAGLVACSDIAVASQQSKFAFSEVRLGIVPAVISPFVLRKIGSRNARRYFLTGERFDATRAQQLGLVHEVVSENELDEHIERIVTEALLAGPEALRAAKALIERVAEQPIDDKLLNAAAETIAELRVVQEAQDGFAAFLQKRPAPWIVSDEPSETSGSDGEPSK